MPLLSYGLTEAGMIGDFVPLIMMREEKRDQVELDNKEVNKRVSSAFK